MPISLENSSNIRVTYNTGSNYVIETVKSDMYVRDTIGTTSNLFAEPIINPSITPVTTGNHKTLNLTFNRTKHIEYLIQQKTGVGGWRLVRSLPPTATSHFPTIDNLAGTATVGTAYNYTNYWTVPFGTFDEFVFTTFNTRYWLQTTKDQAIGTNYSYTPRTVIKSSISSTSYTAIWYHRYTEDDDPQIGLRNHGTAPFGNPDAGGDLILYKEIGAYDYTGAGIAIDGGLCVLVRNSTSSTSITEPNKYTLTFPFRTVGDVYNNSNLILQGDYNVSVGHPTSSVLPTITNTSNTLIPLPNTNTSNLAIRYHTLNPVKTPEGAQWTYSSNNPNVYHLGSVGIGTTSPEYSLDVRGFIYSSSGGYTSSALTKWSVLSDRRIKENIVKASYDKCLENVKNIELYNFNFKDNYVNTNDRHQLGFIAQEVQQIYPKAVEVSRMIMNLEEKIDDLLTLNTTQIDYTLYGSVKCLIQKLENIKIKMEQIKTVYNITT